MVPNLHHHGFDLLSVRVVDGAHWDKGEGYASGRWESGERQDVGDMRGNTCNVQVLQARQEYRDSSCGYKCGLPKLSRGDEVRILRSCIRGERRMRKWSLFLFDYLSITPTSCRSCPPSFHCNWDYPPCCRVYILPE